MGGSSAPAVSVIIPVYNGTNYLREAIDSVLSQTFTDFELVVVDDGSTDGTWEIIQSYRQPVRGLRKPNGGVASALNAGIRAMRGQWFAWLSHDDVFMPAKLEKQVEFLQQSRQFKACYTDYLVIDARGILLEEVETPWYPRAEAARTLFHSMYINGSTMLVERTCFENVGLFSEKWRYTQDADMWLRILSHFEIGRVPEKLVKQRRHAEQGSRHLTDHLAEMEAMYAQAFEALGVAALFPELSQTADPRTLSRAYQWLGDTMLEYRGRGWAAFASQQYRRALALYPSWRNPAWYKLSIRPMLSAFRQSYGSARRVMARIRNRLMHR